MDGGCYGAEGARSHMRTCRTRGFTLIEILVVIVVIAVLASLVAPNVFTHVGEAKNVTAGSQIEMLGAALDAYRLDNGRYPTTAQGLAALWQAPAQDPRPASWNGPYDPMHFQIRPPPRREGPAEKALWALNNLFGLKPQINAGYRTAADQQDERNRRRRGENRNQVAGKISDHQLGNSVDLQPGMWLNTSSGIFPAVVELMKAYGFEWQGPGDPPHFYHRGSLSPAERQSLAKRIENFYKRCINPNAF